jgi:aralkylamine N-acetyltransferase
MEIKYQNNLEGINWQEESELFQLLKWGTRDPEEIRLAFETSSHVRFAFNNGQLVGFGRTVDDGKYYALVVDLIVTPEFQNKGIGKKILAELRDALESYDFTTLSSAVGKESFYFKQGWEKQKSAFIWPRSESQRANHVKKKKAAE